MLVKGSGLVAWLHLRSYYGEHDAPATVGVVSVIRFVESDHQNSISTALERCALEQRIEDIGLQPIIHVRNLLLVGAARLRHSGRAVVAIVLGIGKDEC